MAYQGISTGTSPNDNTGDSLLIGAVKVNSNFKEIYNALGDGSNINFNQTTTITAGNGLTGGGNLSANRTLNVGAGTGIDVAEDSISINSSYRFPSGTRMLFQQSTAPTGWTKDENESLNDRALRVVSGTAGYGGNTAFTSVFASNISVPLPQHSHGITEPENGQGHQHLVYGQDNDAVATGAASNEVSNVSSHDGPNNFFSRTTSFSTTGITINNEGTPGATMNFAVQYIDVIIAQRN